MLITLYFPLRLALKLNKRILAKKNRVKKGASLKREMKSVSMIQSCQTDRQKPVLTLNRNVNLLRTKTNI
jgi:hypothetical protein